MQQKLKQVREFLTAMGAHLAPGFKFAEPKNAELVATLIKEEYEEYEDAAEYSVDQLDALVDLVYVTLNGFAYLGLDCASEYPVTYNSMPGQNLYGAVASARRRLGIRPLCQNECDNGLNFVLNAAVVRSRQLNYDLDTAFDRVHRANMGKFWTHDELELDAAVQIYRAPGTDKYIVKRPDGKVVKPPSFRPPDLIDLVNAARAKAGLPALDQLQLS